MPAINETGSNGRDKFASNLYKNHWKVRNNSANVSAAFSLDLYNSDNEYRFRKPSSKSSNKQSEDSSEDCYCNRPPVSPKLLVSAEQKMLGSNRGKCVHLQCCKCIPHHSDDVLSKSKRSQDSDWTKTFRVRRPEMSVVSYGRNSDAYHGDYSSALVTLSDADLNKTAGNLNMESLDKTLATLKLDDGNLGKLNVFRKDNYFDCYSLVNPTEEHHQCVHKFILDDRLIPRPLNADAFGTSRCVVCNQPFNKNSERFEPVRAKSGTSLDTSKYSLSKYRNNIHINTSNDRIEVKVPASCKFYDNLMKTTSKIRKPVTVNSLALRQQKGVL